MKVIVLGGQGNMGGRVAQLLESAGHQAILASRSTGIDAYTGTGLADSFAGADAVVDCLNIISMKADVCVDFYETTARNVIRAAEDARVAHLVCVSIVNARNPEINRHMGYYRGKAAQEARYQNAPVPTTIVRSTQWFELTETLINQLRVGPIALVPRMMSQPVAADAVARVIVSAVELGTEAPAGVELAGPEPRNMAKLARLVAHNNNVLQNGAPHTRVIAVPVPGIKVLNGGLLPGVGVAKDPTTFEEWLTNGRTASNSG
ncbi:SDR family oxidoreductase [Paeniglutamicibacter kerguelensis]|uniref:Uncharacterized protein YbjT (DUF2867 family) n=1 Tax=Paeniglutamicibacter kerguelensis TaxID=254788 RepID=A0ABS4XJ88_9MICC|nr:NAD(P)H-binding protein [Paeniglutamicibacter kerguelensis]MBP2388520.1 uncharacterized protein YbjT (DUF2867 family) [Paeniglutamicibacter kerguelensis]